MADSTLARVRSHFSGIDKILNPARAVEPYAKSTIHLIRSEGEAAFTGFALAAIKHKFLGGSLDYKGKPVDGILAGLGIVATIFLSADGDGLSVDARNITGNLTALYVNRISDNYFAKQSDKVQAAGDIPSLDELSKELG